MYGLPKNVIIRTHKELVELHKMCIVTYLSQVGVKHRTQKKFFKLYDVYITHENILHYFHRPIRLFVRALVANRLEEISYYGTYPTQLKTASKLRKTIYVRKTNRNSNLR